MINTVVLFLRDTLPIFLLLSLLFSLNVSAKPLAIRISVAAIISTICYLNIGIIAQTMNGSGFELLKVCCLLLSWIGFCLYISTLAPSTGLWLMVVGVCLPATLHFLIYFVSSWALHANDNGLLMGSIIGLGISCSVAILLNIALTTLVSLRTTRIMTTLFFAGQVASLSNLLEQIDFLVAPIHSWDTSHFISDSSEYGHLLNALVGYEATPSLSYLFIYFLALLIPFLLLLWAKKQCSSSHSALEEQC